MNNQTHNQGTSWTVVIIVLIIFWPVGIFLLIGKLSSDRSASFGGGTAIIKFLGWGLIGFGAIMLAFGTSDPEYLGTGIGMGLFFALPGFWLIKKAKKSKRLGDKNRSYIQYIVNNEVRDIVELSNRMNFPKETVVSDVNDMIAKGMLGAARLNLNTGTIQFPAPKARPQVAQQPQYSQSPNSHHNSARQEPRAQAVPKTIKCPGCGANNQGVLLPAECDFCGTSLS